MIRLSVYVAFCIAVLTGCSSAPNTAHSNTTGNLAPFVRLNGITYLATHPSTESPLRADMLGPEFAHVKSMIDEQEVNLTYRPTDGDAAYLPAGTPVFALKEYDPQFRLAAWQDTHLTLYEVDTNPIAQHGAELLDIESKVAYISINSATDGTTERATIIDKQQLITLVDMVLQAPVNQQARSDGDDTRYFLVFHLHDGTTVRRTFWPKSGELSRGIMLPKEFSEAVQRAVQNRS